MDHLQNNNNDNCTTGQRCSVCFVKFSDVTFLLKHLHYHRENYFFCKYENCGVSFKCLFDCEAHEMRDHEYNKCHTMLDELLSQRTCSFCRKYFNTELQLHVHWLSKEDNVCGKLMQQIIKQYNDLLAVKLKNNITNIQIPSLPTTKLCLKVPKECKIEGSEASKRVHEAIDKDDELAAKCTKFNNDILKHLISKSEPSVAQGYSNNMIERNLMSDYIIPENKIKRHADSFALENGETLSNCVQFSVPENCKQLQDFSSAGEAILSNQNQMLNFGINDIKLSPNVQITKLPTSNVTNTVSQLSSSSNQSIASINNNPNINLTKNNGVQLLPAAKNAIQINKLSRNTRLIKLPVDQGQIVTLNNTIDDKINLKPTSIIPILPQKVTINNNFVVIRTTPRTATAATTPMPKLIPITNNTKINNITYNNNIESVKARTFSLIVPKNAINTQINQTVSIPTTMSQLPQSSNLTSKSKIQLTDVSITQTEVRNIITKKSNTRVVNYLRMKTVMSKKNLKAIENLPTNPRIVKSTNVIGRKQEIAENKSPNYEEILKVENSKQIQVNTNTRVPPSFYVPLYTAIDINLVEACRAYKDYHYRFLCPYCPYSQKEYELKATLRMHLLDVHDGSLKGLNSIFVEAKAVPGNRNVIPKITINNNDNENNLEILFGDINCKLKCNNASTSNINEKCYHYGKCGKLCQTRINVNKDLLADYARKQRHICTMCQKDFHSNGALQCHMMIHSGELPYQCSYCEKRFRTRGQVTVHHRTYTGEKPFVCQVCSLCFTHRETLIAHLSRHIGMKRYKCYGCDQKFSCISSLKTHRDIRPYTCGKVQFNPRPVGPRVRVVRGNVIFEP